MTPRHLGTIGAVSEINMIVWPPIYGVTGHVVGSLFGLGVAGAIVGVVLGFFVGGIMTRMLFFDIELFAPLAFVPIAAFAPAPVKVWLMGAVCLSPWVRMLISGIQSDAEQAAKRKRFRSESAEKDAEEKSIRERVEEVAQCSSGDEIVPYLGDDRHRVVAAAVERLYALDLTHDKVVGIILNHSATLDRSHTVDPKRCRWLRELVTPLAEVGPNARDALLDLYAELG